MDPATSPPPSKSNRPLGPTSMPLPIVSVPGPGQVRTVVPLPASTIRSRTREGLVEPATLTPFAGLIVTSYGASGAVFKSQLAAVFHAPLLGLTQFSFRFTRFLTRNPSLPPKV